MKNISQIIIKALLAGCLATAGMVFATGCGSSENSTSDGHSQKADKPVKSWQDANDQKLNKVCGERTALGTTAIAGRYDHRWIASQTVALVVTCSDGSIHTVTIQTPSVD